MMPPKYIECSRCHKKFIPPDEDYDGYCPQCLEDTTNRPIRPADLIFPEGYERKKKGLCPTCEHKIDPNEFRDEQSLREYRISGMCQKCQDIVFRH